MCKDKMKRVAWNTNMRYDKVNNCMWHRSEVSTRIPAANSCHIDNPCSGDTWYSELQTLTKCVEAKSEITPL